MKKLFLALLLSITAIAAVGRAPRAVAAGICSPGQVWRAYYFYEYPGGPYCGLTYQYCEGPPRYHDGCTTAYYETDVYCGCP
jgi:hypothetical protein